jgi:2-hydroxychromene-2-carboxylate isomerase
MTLTYDLFWSFRSPYSYLVTPRLLEFERDFDVPANVRPVYPIAVPLMVFNGEPFFGQDRFETLKWRMAQNGVRRRAAGATRSAEGRIKRS